MRRFVVEALVDAASLVAIIFVLGLITVPQPFPFGTDTRPIVELTGSGLGRLLVAAAILVLAERFVRPVIIAFTGRLLLSTFGLFLVVVNAHVIWVASLVAPDIAPSPSRALWFAGVRRPLHALARRGRATRPEPSPRCGPAGHRAACGASWSRCRRRAAT